MSKSHILALIVMTSLATYNIIQAGVIREQNIPELDIAKIVGKWYRLTSDNGTAEQDGLGCIIYDIRQTFMNAFAMTKIETAKPGIKEISPDVSNNHTRRENFVINGNDNIITMIMDFSGMKMVVFDVEYDSYMAMYVTLDKVLMSDSASGYVVIFSRQKTLPESVINKIKNSDFYQQGVSDTYKTLLRISNITDCP